MAALSDTDRAAVWADFMRDTLNVNAGASTVNKVDLRAAIDAADTWADANTTSYNSALPLPARTSLSTKQKAAILNYVIARRYLVS